MARKAATKRTTAPTAASRRAKPAKTTPAKKAAATPGARSAAKPAKTSRAKPAKSAAKPRAKPAKKSAAKPRAKPVVKARIAKQPRAPKPAAARPSGAGRVLEILDDADPIDALGRFLASIGATATVTEGQIALGAAQLILLPIAREHRGGPEVQALLDLMFASWSRFPDREGFHAQEFLRNAFAAVGEDRARLDQLLVVVPDAASTELRYSIASALAIAGEKDAMLAWLRAAIASGTSPAQIRRDADFAAWLGDPDLAALLDGATTPTIPVRIEPHVRPVRVALDQLFETLERLGQPGTRNPPTSLEAILETERRRRIQLPNDYRALLTITDGFAIFDDVFLGTHDFLSETPLAKEARAYLEMSARDGAPGIDACIPLANWGQPNDWLLYDPLGYVRRGEPGYVLVQNADEQPLADLVSALARIGRIAADILATN